MLDRIIEEFDQALKVLSVKAFSQRIHPDTELEDCRLTEINKKQVISLMRVNHCGEICAQALYYGQTLSTKNQQHQKRFKNAALEESDHLAWLETRIKDLGGKLSLLNPLFYLASFSLGVGAGLLVDKWGLGFIKETENQVMTHLASHLEKIPPRDLKSIAILQQIQIDENEHAVMAKELGASELPILVKKLMHFSAKIMTISSYYI